MADFDTPADPKIEAIADEPSSPAKAAPAEPPKITPQMIVADSAGIDAAMAAIKAQPKVKIRIPKVHGPQTVIINGARFDIASNVFVDVPQQVADVLADAGRI